MIRSRMEGVADKENPVTEGFLAKKMKILPIETAEKASKRDEIACTTIPFDRIKSKSTVGLSDCSSPFYSTQSNTKSVKTTIRNC